MFFSFKAENIIFLKYNIAIIVITASSTNEYSCSNLTNMFAEESVNIKRCLEKKMHIFLLVHHLVKGLDTYGMRNKG